MLSLIFSNKGDLDSLRLLKLESQNKQILKEIELIIIDSLWEQQKGEQFRDLVPLLKKVVYAPPKIRFNTMRYDLLSGYNTGLAYAEEPFCMITGGKNEFAANFFYNLMETIDNFGISVAIRPVELEANNGDVRWVSYIKFPQRYFILPCNPLGREGLRSILPIITSGFIIMSRFFWYGFNGINEEYDVGCKWWDNELLDRLYVAKTPVVVDQKLMIYRYPHVSMSPPEYGEECKQIYDKKQWSKDNIWRVNDFNLARIHDEFMMTEKYKYIL